MLGPGNTLHSLFDSATVAQVTDTQVDVFNELYWLFVIVGTLVGVVVISYILYNAYKYRTDEPTPEGRYDIDPESFDDEDDPKVARPRLGEVPSAAETGSGKKLFLSFAISAIIVLGLIIFAYYNLLYVESTAEIEEDEEALEVYVLAERFFFEYEYPSGETFDELVVPKDAVVTLNVTSCHPGECDNDVMHNWGSPDFRAKSDAIPGQYTQTWLMADEVGEYRAICYELCGAGHHDMREDEGIVVKEDEAWIDWCDGNDCLDGDREDIVDWLEEARGEN